MSLKKIHIFLSLSIFLLACSSNPKTSFYQLKEIDGIEAGDKENHSKSHTLVISSLKFPEYLDQPQIIIRTSDIKFQLSENHHWAEPLENEFIGVFMGNINNRIYPNQIIKFEQLEGNKPIIYLSIEVLRFDVNAEQQAVLSVKWMNWKDKNHRPIKWLTKNFKVAVKDNSYESKVVAQSKTIALFSDYMVKLLITDSQ